MKKTMHKLISLIVVFSICFLTGCVDGLVREDQLINLIDGIQCETIYNNLYFYQIETLTNNISFDEEIMFDSYSKLTLKTKENCEIKGIAFVVRSLQKANLNFQVLIQDEVLLGKEYNLTENTNEFVSLFLNESVLVGDNNLLTINISEQVDELDENFEYTTFAFDSFLIFFKE